MDMLQNLSGGTDFVGGTLFVKTEPPNKYGSNLIEEPKIKEYIILLYKM